MGSVISVWFMWPLVQGHWEFPIGILGIWGSLNSRSGIPGNFKSFWFVKKFWQNTAKFASFASVITKTDKCISHLQTLQNSRASLTLLLYSDSHCTTTVQWFSLYSSSDALHYMSVYWDALTEALTATAQECCAVTLLPNKPWIDAECWKVIEERWQAKKEYFQGERYMGLKAGRWRSATRN